MNNNFRLKDFMNGVPAKTVKGDKVKFVALMPKGIPARLCVDVDGSLESYYINGSYLGGKIKHEKDIVMASYFD